MTSLTQAFQALEQSAAARVLTERALIEVRGDDRQSWLNGQITQDIKLLASDKAFYALAVNVKGKIIADLWVSEKAESLWLDVPKSALEELIAHFEHYIIMEDVELKPHTELSILTIQGPKSQAAHHQAITLNTWCYQNTRLGNAGFDIICTNDDRETLPPKLGIPVVDENAWEAYRIKRGIARFGNDFGPEYLPQEANLEDAAVSFKKGCYLGQEVICMLENRGKTRRKLVALKGPSHTSLKPGVDLNVIADTAEPVWAGQLTSVAIDPTDPSLSHALAYLQNKFIAPEYTFISGGARLSLVS